MKILAGDIMKFAKGDGMYRLHTGSGKFHTEIQPGELEELAGRGWITAYAKGGRLTWVQLRVPPYVADRLLFPDRGGRRKAPQTVFHSEANDTLVRERSTTTLLQTYRHHAERCSAFRAGQLPVASRNL